MQKNPIFIHSLFRTGSTYIWSKFRQDKGYCCYYEPFHPDLANLEIQNPDPWRYDNISTRLMRHPDLDIGYLNEYVGTLRPGVKGVPYFNKSFSYDNFCGTGKDEIPDQKKYIDYLIASAGEKIPLLQFNRSSFRVSWFKANYPEALHIYLLRNPKDQFHSYMDIYEQAGLNSFLTMDIIIAGVNCHSDFFAPLTSHIPVLEYHSGHFDHERFIYSLQLPIYSTTEKYSIFYYTWFVAMIENALAADFLLNMDMLSVDDSYRNAVYRFLQAQDVPPIDFNDAKIRRYESTVFNKGEMDRVEETMQTLSLELYDGVQIERAASHIGPEQMKNLNLNKSRLLELKKKKKFDNPIPRKTLIEKYSLAFSIFCHKLIEQRASINNLEKVTKKQKDEIPKLLKNELEQKDIQLVEKDRHLMQKDRALEQKDLQLAEKDRQLAEKDRHLMQKDQALEQKDIQLVEKDRHLIQKDQALEQKSLLLTERDLRMKEMQLRIKTAVEENTSLAKDIESKEKEIDALKSQLIAIQTNRYVKLLKSLNMIERKNNE